MTKFKMYYLLLLLLLLFPLGQLLRIPLGIPSVSLYGLDIVALGCLVGLLFYISKSKDYILKSRLLAPLACFVGFGALGLLLNPLHLRYDQISISALYLLRFVVYVSLYLVARLVVHKNPERKKTLLYGLFAAGVTLGVLGIGQYFFYPNLRNLYYLGWDPHLYRLFSTFFDPNFAGIVLVLTVLLGGGLWMEEKKKLSYLGRLGYLSILGLLLLSLLLTYSRSSYLALIVGLVVLFRRYISWKWIVGGVLGFVLILYLLPRTYGEGVRLERTSTILSRLEGYQSAMTIIIRNPITGVGFNAYRYVQRQMGYLPATDWEDVHSGSGTDNSFLFVWATTGMGGISAFIWLLYRMLTLSTAQKIENDVLVSSTVVVVIHSLFVNSFFYIWVLAWVFILTGALEASRSVVKR